MEGEEKWACRSEGWHYIVINLGVRLWVNLGVKPQVEQGVKRSDTLGVKAYYGRNDVIWMDNFHISQTHSREITS